MAHKPRARQAATIDQILNVAAQKVCASVKRDAKWCEASIRERLPCVWCWFGVVCVCLFMRAYTHMCVCLCVCECVCVCVFFYACMCVHVCVSV